MKRLLTCIASASLCALAISAGQFNKAAVIHKASASPKLTGTLTNPAWREAAVFTKMYTVRPQLGAAATEKTSSFVMFDDENLYVAFRCYDKKPDQIRADAQDASQAGKDDWVAFAIDPAEAHDHATYFLVTAGGIQADGTIDPAGNRRSAPARKWTSVARQIPGGWGVEIKIPLDTIPLDVKSTKLLAVNFIRHIARNDEEDQGPVPASSDRSIAAQFRSAVIQP